MKSSCKMGMGKGISHRLMGHIDWASQEVVQQDMPCCHKRGLQPVVHS